MPAPAAAVTRSAVPFNSDEMSLVLQPGEGAEIKALMRGGESFVFSWTTDGGPVNFDMHGERPNAGDEFSSYWKDRGRSSGHRASRHRSMARTVGTGEIEASSR